MPQRNKLAMFCWFFPVTSKRSETKAVQTRKTQRNSTRLSFHISASRSQVVLDFLICYRVPSMLKRLGERSGCGKSNLDPFSGLVFCRFSFTRNDLKTHLISIKKRQLMKQLVLLLVFQATIGFGVFCFFCASHCSMAVSWAARVCTCNKHVSC